MKTHQAIVLTVFVGLLAGISCQDEGQFYCGRRLSSALAMLCENGLIKRSDNRVHMVEDYEAPWIPVHHARTMGRSKRQVVSECCYKPCRVSELLAYCAS